MQMRARALMSGVAGKPTTTSATPRSQHSREAAAILPGWNSITGCVRRNSAVQVCPLHLHVPSVTITCFVLNAKSTALNLPHT